VRRRCERLLGRQQRLEIGVAGGDEVAVEFDFDRRLGAGNCSLVHRTGCSGGVGSPVEGGCAASSTTAGSGSDAGAPTSDAGSAVSSSTPAGRCGR